MRVHKINSRRALLIRAARKITRRRLIACAGAAACAAKTAWGKPMIFRGGSPQAAPPVASVPGVQFLNTSASDSPADVPYTVKMEFVRGEVPTGYIAVPQVSAVDQTYQASNVRYWDDGSLFSAVFYVVRSSAHPGSGNVSFDFDVRAGSYSNTSTTTLTDMASADYRISVSNCHTASVDLDPTGQGNMVALTIGGGAVNGTKVWRIDSGTGADTASATAVKSLTGSGAQVSLVSGVPTIVSGGSGYSLVGTGAFTASFASIISAVQSGGNNTGGVEVKWYARGPVMDGLRATMAVPGFNHMYVRFWIERWKKTNGTFLAWAAVGKIGSMLVDTVNQLPNYTFDMDWIGPDGSTVIRGASAAYAPHTTIVQWVATGNFTFAEDCQPDWSANSAAYNALKPMRSSAQCDHQKLAGLQIPWRIVTPSRTPPSSHSAYEQSNSTDGGVSQIGDYWPTGTAGIRCRIGTGGGGNVIGPMTEIDGLYFLEQRAGRTANALVYLRNIEVAAAASSQLAQLGGAIYEPTTMRVPCVIPTSVHTFTGMIDRSGINIHPSYIQDGTAGSGNPHIGLGRSQVAAGWTYHNTCSTIGAHMATGRQWWADSLFDAASTIIFAENPYYGRQVTVGSTTYYGLKAVYPNSIRDQAWTQRTIVYALAVRADAWADGEADPEREHLAFCMDQWLLYITALIPHTGTVKVGSGGANLTKTQNFAGTGVDPEDFDPASSNNSMAGDQPYMYDYRMMIFSVSAYLFQGQFGNRFKTLLDYYAIAYVKWWAHSGSHYYNTSYRRMVFDGPQPSGPVDTDYNLPNPADPKIMITAGPNDPFATMAFTSGSDVVTLNQAVYADRDNNLMADGSRIRLTSDNISAVGIGGVAPPSPYDMTTKYYWKGINSTSGRLCTDAGLTTTPGVAAASTSGTHFWCVYSNAQPADTAGRGEYRYGPDASGSSVLYTTYGTLRILKAYGMLTAALDIDAAINNAKTTYESISGALPEQTSYLPYSWSTSRSS